ncbi:MAG: histidinol-phosphate transaminase [Betaproteobacteria bacterium HGW-Betaproteobacteria-11]|nr:MAG: histidinol-phosphate transaminase [Betaproteobacteria bacterium HGW-Betaproteobacteria-11]
MKFLDYALPYVCGIQPYVPGKPVTQLVRELGLQAETIVKLASNENPLGMSPQARQAVVVALGGVARYPDQHALTAALAAHHGVSAEQIVLGNGSNDVLDLVARVFLAQGRSAVMSEYAFAVYPLVTQATGAECLVAPAYQFGHDPVALKAALRADTRVLWIANPNNPTGTFLPQAVLRGLLAAVPEEVVVVLDEAYTEYLSPAERMDSIAWIAEFPNLVVTRTFSKIYGLAGLRVGYAVARTGVAALMQRVRQPFNVGNLGLVAALAALDDHLFIAESYTLNHRGMEEIVAGLKRLGLEHIPSHGNFVTFAVADAPRVNQHLLAQGVIVRPLDGYGMPRHLRVTIGRDTENRRFLEALEKALHS